MPTTTDKPTVESDDVHTIRCRNVVRHGAIDDATTDNSAFGTAAMKKAADDVDLLLAEVKRLKAELPPHKTINLLTTLEHQVYRNHQFLPEGCSECSMTETIVKKLREELGL